MRTPCPPCPPCNDALAQLATEVTGLEIRLTTPTPTPVSVSVSETPVSTPTPTPTPVSVPLTLEFSLRGEYSAYEALFELAYSPRLARLLGRYGYQILYSTLDTNQLGTSSFNTKKPFKMAFRLFKEPFSLSAGRAKEGGF